MSMAVTFEYSKRYSRLSAVANYLIAAALASRVFIWQILEYILLVIMVSLNQISVQSLYKEYMLWWVPIDPWFYHFRDKFVHQ